MVDLFYCITSLLRSFGWVKNVKKFGWVKNLEDPGFSGLGCYFITTIADKIFRKSKKIKQKWAKRENLDICFYVIFDDYYQRFFSGIENGY